MDQKELLRTIAQAAAEGWTTLDLSNQGLTELSPEIGRLTHLKELRLRHNQLSVLPAEIEKLTNLVTLDLGDNLLSDFPSTLGKLTELRWIHLKNNQLITLPHEIWNLKNLKRLELSYNRITTLPSEIGQLIHLRRLSFEHNQIAQLPIEIGELRDMEMLNLRGNKLTFLPQEIGKLTNLISLDLCNNQISVLPAEIGKLTKLTHLNLIRNPLPVPSNILESIHAPAKIIKYYLSDQTKPEKMIPLTHRLIRDDENSQDYSYRQLTELPPEIWGITNLTRLYLSYNKLSTLPPEIGKFITLKRLSLQYNQLMTLPPSIGNLTNLTILIVGGNRLTTLPSEIWDLINLQTLDLEYNMLKMLAPEIGNLKHLTRLFLKHNQLTRLPVEIWGLENLGRLELGYNQLVILPPEIGRLTNLGYLEAQDNHISELPGEIGNLTNLQGLNLKNNQLTTLPSEINNLKNLKELILQGNPLPIPPEILALRSEPTKILTYYFEHQQKQKKPLNEAKALIVGQGAVGKTSLIKRLLEDTFDPHETKTDGIAITHWHLTIDATPIRLNVWDFGGQEIMHATHQFFLTKRSLYVLVLDSRLSEQENRLEYWLKIIQSFGGDSPVIVVCNKNDQHDLDLDWKGLQNKYPSIKAFAKTVSCKTGDGIPQLKTQIEREVAQLEHLHDELILPWFAVKTQLEEMQRDYISYGDYQQMCQQADVTDELSQQTLLGFLHDLGIVLHFHDHPLLEDTNVLNPAWVTRGVYQLLNSNELFQRKGELDRAALGRILDPQTYPRSKHSFIIDMMRKFELCFDFAEFSGERFLVPDLLAKEEPYTGEWADSLAFQYHYDILPGSVLSRFMVRMHAYIHQRTYWRNGVVLISEDGKNRALVKADLEDKTIFIFVSGRPEARHLFLELIRADFRKIHKTIPKLAVTEVVPLPDQPDVLIDYADLLKLRERGIKTYYYPKADAEINVDQLLDGLEPGKGQSMLSAGLQHDIVAFLASIPGIQDRNAQHALIYSAGLDAQLQQRINFSGATAQFFELLVPQLNGYGRLADGQLALTAVLQAAKEQVGHDRQTYCDTLIHAVQREFAE